MNVHRPHPMDEEHGADAGITLIELVVAMTIMSIVMAIFTSGIMQMYHSADKAESLSTATSEVNSAFLRLDSEMRYASGIDAVGNGTTTNDPYVEYQIPAGALPNSAPTPSPSATGTGSADPTCVELRLDGGRLQYRSFASSATSAPAFISLISGVTATTPFTRLPASDPVDFQRLQINVQVTVGTDPSGSPTGHKSSTRNLNVTFTALNTGLTTPIGPFCTKFRS